MKSAQKENKPKVKTNLDEISNENVSKMAQMIGAFMAIQMQRKADK